MNINGSGLLDVDIKHNKGKASEVFSSRAGVGIVYLVLLVIILIYFCLSAKSFVDDYWISSVLQYDKKKILNKKKPFYLSESKWKEIKELSIKNELAEIRNESFISIESLKDSKAAFYLTSKNIEKLEVSDEEKKKIISEVSKIYIENYRNKCNRLYSESECIIAFSILRPELIEEAKWIEERDRLLKIAKDYFISRCYDFYDIPKTSVYFDNILSAINVSDVERNKFKQDIKQWWKKSIEQRINGLSFESGKTYIENLLQTETPVYFTKSEWESIKSIANDKYLEIVLYELSYSSKGFCEKILKNENSIIKYLSDDNRRKITKFAEQWYCLLLMEDSLVLSYKELVNKYDLSLFDSQQINRILQLVDNAQAINELLNLPVEKIEKLQIPKTVDTSLWNSIVVYRTRKDELNNKLIEVNNEESKLKLKIEKVSKQLAFINSFLDSPDAIDRIEDYEDLFSKGNYKNLKKIKDLLEKK